ncbi:hypothetical protein FJ934_11515 [Mesorhizobium sp. B2-4-12]|uniref:hypothetical protein n=1 Tax=Mesorhizobium sp. B2-4-12 TaxID=2589937 RepID=UPI00112E73D5|nr:hypothetical protein [Mesorhizobium sp. B2-4-12]TPK95544.1 hypothetical protein FJ934_11515 [Mesorhizobium sp. B2-4-12]
MRKTVPLLLAASLCGCVAVAPKPDPGDQRVNPIPISLALEEIVTTGIRQRLEDPASARFETVLAGERILNGHREIVVCGHVSVKKSSGDHGTDEPFAAKIYPDAGSSFELVAMGDQSPNASLLIGDTCRAAGLAILDSKLKASL